MINGEPRLSKRNDQRVLVDANGDELVCRRYAAYTNGCFHRVDLDQFARDGSIKPRCEHVTGRDDDRWVLKRRTTIAQTWEGCQYTRCYGDDDPTTTGDTGPHLRTILDEMTVDEFETITAEHRTTPGDGGERV